MRERGGMEKRWSRNGGEMNVGERRGWRRDGVGMEEK